MVSMRLSVNEFASASTSGSVASSASRAPPQTVAGQYLPALDSILEHRHCFRRRLALLRTSFVNEVVDHLSLRELEACCNGKYYRRLLNTLRNLTHAYLKIGSPPLRLPMTAARRARTQPRCPLGATRAGAPTGAGTQLPPLQVGGGASVICANVS